MEAIEQALGEGRARMLEAFGAKAAHDFNNLLAVILGNIELIEETSQDEEAAPMLRLIREAGQRGEQLAARLMRISGGEAAPSAAAEGPPRAGGAEAMVQEILGTGCRIELVVETGNVEAVEGAALDAALLHLCICLHKVLPQGGRLSISVGREAATGP
jgi:signal transduction histidine kinase